MGQLQTLTGEKRTKALPVKVLLVQETGFRIDLKKKKQSIKHHHGRDKTKGTTVQNLIPSGTQETAHRSDLATVEQNTSSGRKLRGKRIQNHQNQRTFAETFLDPGEVEMTIKSSSAWLH